MVAERCAHPSCRASRLISNRVLSFTLDDPACAAALHQVMTEKNLTLAQALRWSLDTLILAIEETVVEQAVEHVDDELRELTGET